ncbi:hypothetical protein GAY29_02185 [Azospirillum brasilense]|nr:hypothetical protein [Azospirillum brasilense]
MCRTWRRAQPPHPNPLHAFGGPKVRLSRQRKLRLRVSGGERGFRKGRGRLGRSPFSCHG